ncbi:MAG: hypothetical protein QM282_04830 [Bacteroidota bacterium]|nr:hypothetical protein [Bacteroidota bacterium]
MKKYFVLLSVVLLMISCKKTADTNLPESTVQQALTACTAQSELPDDLIEKGLRQCAGLWTPADGSPEEFVEFCKIHLCADAQQKSLLFERMADHFETLLGHQNRVRVELMRPLHETGYQNLPVDQLFGAYDNAAHFEEDMYGSKIAFVVALNFPYFSLDEKTALAEEWTSEEWGYARLGDFFIERIPASVKQEMTLAATRAEDYISNYNIHMGSLVDRGEKLFPDHMVLISHWGLRDELKSNYADKERGLQKQEIIYRVMQHIIEQSIPLQVIDNPNYDWDPINNKLYLEGKEIAVEAEPDTRYEHFLNLFKTYKAQDNYSRQYPSYIARYFEGELEIAEKEVEALFVELLSSKQAALTGQLIAQRLGRKLRPYDIWYDGFKSRSSIDPAVLDKIVLDKYPSLQAFEQDLPVILVKMGFSKQKAKEICAQIEVNPSVGSGHAWPAAMKNDKIHLRARFRENGVDYKAYNIATHEFGHNVEEYISLYDVPNYFLSSVPNNAFTEALAFVFQERDLDLLGLKQQDPLAASLNTLDLFWSSYEIMGVALVDMKVWRWMYENPSTDAVQLKENVIRIAKGVWNDYYAPVFGIEDQNILAVYSHMIEIPLYLPAYPLGHLIHFQLNEHFEGKDMGAEIQRIYALGRLSPQYWMQKAVGSKLSAEPLLKATSLALEQVMQ